jgi:hypothetical protein
MLWVAAGLMKTSLRPAAYLVTPHIFEKIALFGLYGSKVP